MVRDIRKGLINAIICWKLDRLARNPEEAGIILGMLKRGELKRIITNDRIYLSEDNALLGQDLNFGVGDIDIKRYIKFLLKDGSMEEKREILSSMKSSITLTNKLISFT